MKGLLLRIWRPALRLTLALFFGAATIAVAQDGQIRTCVSQDGSPRIV